MAIQWWELWSPGLQCLGAMLEAGGVVMFAKDWWRSNESQRTEAEQSSVTAWHIGLVGRSNTGRAPRLGSIVDVDAVSRADILENAKDRRLQRILDDNRSREWNYKIALGMIGAGIGAVLFANGIAWAGAYGMLPAAN